MRLTAVAAAMAAIRIFTMVGGMTWGDDHEGLLGYNFAADVKGAGFQFEIEAY